MNRQTKSDAVWSIDDLELELRQLPGVQAAGFDESPDVLLVQLHVADDAGRAERGDQSVPVSASRIAARHSDRPVAVEVVRWRAAPTAPPPAEITEPVVLTAISERAEVVLVEASRPRLLAVLAFPDTDELEVHLVLDGRRTIGRAAARRGIDGAVEATIDAAERCRAACAMGARDRRTGVRRRGRRRGRARRCRRPAVGAVRHGVRLQSDRRGRPCNARRVESPPRPRGLSTAIDREGRPLRSDALPS
jgi:hypothetical protein